MMTGTNSLMGGRGRVMGSLVALALAAGGTAGALGLGSGEGSGGLTPGWAAFQVSTADPLTNEPYEQATIDRSLRDFAALAASDSALSRVVEDPGVKAQAPKWVARFTTDKGLDLPRAMADLRNRTSVRIVPGSSMFELHVDADDKFDSAALSGMVRQRFLALTSDIARSRYDDVAAALLQASKNERDRSTSISLQIEQLIVTGQAECDNVDQSAMARELGEVRLRLLDAEGTLASARARVNLIEGRAKAAESAAAGPEDPKLAEARAEVAQIETMRDSLELRSAELRKRLVDLRRLNSRAEDLRAQQHQSCTDERLAEVTLRASLPLSAGVSLVQTERVVDR